MMGLREFVATLHEREPTAPLSMNQSYPKISIIVPSYMQGDFIERTLLSIINQDYPNTELIVIDGGSTDKTVSIIEQYEHCIAHWVSEADLGQTYAINKGIKLATGDWIAWQNSDDLFYPGAFHGLRNAINKYPQVELVAANMMIIDDRETPLRDMRFVKPSFNAMLAEGMLLTNQSAFWKATLHEKIGFLDERLEYAFDYDWFLRVTKHANSVHVNQFWGALRVHRETKTSHFWELYQNEKRLILEGINVGRQRKTYYQLRRAFLMLLQGEVYYLFRGVLQRMRGNRPLKWYDSYLRK
jgi:glycosyltransferase involved in cell wall biosynthesis